MEFRAELEVVISYDLRNVIEHLVRVIRLLELIRVRSKRKTVQADAGHAFHLGGQWNNPRCARTYHKSLRGQAYAHAALLLPQIGGVPQIAEVEFVQRRGTERFRVPQL